MSVIRDVAFWGGIALCAAVVVLFVVLVVHHRYSGYEGGHRFRDDEHPIPEADDHVVAYPAMPVEDRPDGRPA